MSVFVELLLQESQSAISVFVTIYYLSAKKLVVNSRSFNAVLQEDSVPLFSLYNPSRRGSARRSRARLTGKNNPFS